MWAKRKKERSGRPYLLFWRLAFRRCDTEMKKVDRLRTLLIGDFEGAEFASIEESLSASCQAKRAQNIAIAISQLGAGNLPFDAIVLAWPHPGAFSAWEIHRLRKAAPLARQLAVLGSWCEGQRLF